MSARPEIMKYSERERRPSTHGTGMRKDDRRLGWEEQDRLDSAEYEPQITALI